MINFRASSSVKELLILRLMEFA